MTESDRSRLFQQRLGGLFRGAESTVTFRSRSERTRRFSFSFLTEVCRARDFVGDCGNRRGRPDPVNVRSRYVRKRAASPEPRLYHCGQIMSASRLADDERACHRGSIGVEFFASFLEAVQLSPLSGWLGSFRRSSMISRSIRNWNAPGRRDAVHSEVDSRFSRPEVVEIRRRRGTGLAIWRQALTTV